jgi:hypothetical protein
MLNLKIKLIDVWCIFAVRLLTKNDLINILKWFNNSICISSESLKNRLLIKLIENGKL